MFSTDLIKEKTDLRYLKWTRIRKSSGTVGSYLKAYGLEDGTKMYYKLSSYDSSNGITGHECVNELIVDRLLTLLGIDHLHYQLINAEITIAGRNYSTWVCASRDFKNTGDSKIALDEYYELNRREGEKPLDFCVRMGWEKYIYDMLVVDYLILNRDRHGANIEIIKKSNGQAKPAPLFDHGLSLIYSCGSERELPLLDPLEDKKVQCFVGSHSARENLELIPNDKRPAVRELNEKDRAIIFEGLDDLLPETFRDGIWTMIMARLREYENM